MTKEQMDDLMGLEFHKKLVHGQMLVNQKNRTLLYGYTCGRETWHVYLKDGLIYICLYPYRGTPQKIEVTHNAGFIPDKRLYPARCDYEFCRLLKEHGVTNFPFTTFEEVPLNEYSEYYGEIL